MDSFTSAEPKKRRDLCAVGIDLFRVGIRCKCVPGMEVGPALVGLQRMVHESEWPDLYFKRASLWIWRDAFKLLYTAVVHENLR